MLRRLHLHFTLGLSVEQQQQQQRWRETAAHTISSSLSNSFPCDFAEYWKSLFLNLWLWHAVSEIISLWTYESTRSSTRDLIQAGYLVLHFFNRIHMYQAFEYNATITPTITPGVRIKVRGSFQRHQRSHKDFRQRCNLPQSSE